MERTASYIKDIGSELAIELEYIGQTDSEVECVLTFRNKLNRGVVINPTNGDSPRSPKSQQHTNGWLSGVWGSGDDKKDKLKSLGGDKDSIHLFLGYIQLFGYVTLNYKFALDDRSNISSREKAPKNSSWWVNGEYLDMYNEGVNDIYERNNTLDSVPFIFDNLQDQMIVGGKLGGVNDLVIEDDNNATLTIDLNHRYFLQDLVYDFNSFKPLKPENINTDGKLPLKDLTDSIVPFYSTSQSLLFSDLSLSPRAAKSYRFTFPNVRDLPPSYNANLTGITGERGLISIRYLMIVGFLKLDVTNKLAPVSVYFPFDVVGERKGRDDRWLQPNYLQHVTIDKSWKIDPIKSHTRKGSIILERNDTKLEQENNSQTLEEINEAKQMFAEDLDKLVKSDLQNIPKISTTDRKKSISSIYDPDDTKEGLIPQLPSRMKNQFQILVNSNKLCVLKVSKPYYHVGEDLVFHIELENNCEKKYADTVVGVSVHLEAHELFHIDGDRPFTNIYKVTPDAKFNSMANSMLTSHTNVSNSFINGYLNIPNSISQQFQCSKLMDLKYYAVFKFNLFSFDKEQEQEPEKEQEPKNDENRKNSTSDSTSARESPNDNVPIQNLHLDSSASLDSHSASTNGPATKGAYFTESYEFIHKYKFNNVGTDFRFRLPISVLP